MHGSSCMAYYFIDRYAFGHEHDRAMTYTMTDAMGLHVFRIFRLSCYVLPFGTLGRHTQAWASLPPQPVASWPHHHHCWLSNGALADTSSIPRALLKRILSVPSSVFGCFGPMDCEFYTSSLHSAHPSPAHGPTFVAPMVLLR